MKGVPLNEDLYQYIVDTFVKEDGVLEDIIRETEANKFPLIQVSPELGRFLYMLIKILKAKSVLEIGTLAGYSTIWMARALPDGGKLTTLEISSEHAGFALKNIKKAGLHEKIELILGNAMVSLDTLKNKKFDFVFIDADKPGYPAYFEKVIGFMNKGGIIAADNALKGGRVIDRNPDEYTKGVIEYNRLTANDDRVESLLIPISDGLTLSFVK